MIEVKFKFNSKIKNLTFLHSSNFFLDLKVKQAIQKLNIKFSLNLSRMV